MASSSPHGVTRRPSARRLGGSIYSSYRSNVVTVDGNTCARGWFGRAKRPKGLSTDCRPANRGVQYVEGRGYMVPSIGMYCIHRPITAPS
eukprot:1260325-Pyramimonas_sp.AAC.1